MKKSKGLHMTAFMLAVFAFAVIYGSALQSTAYADALPETIPETRQSLEKEYFNEKNFVVSYEGNGGILWEQDYFIAGETITVGEGITKIAEGTFAQMTNLKKVWIPATVTEIEEGAFGNRAKEVVVFTEKDSCAYRYAVENGIKVETEKCFRLKDPEGRCEVVVADPAVNFEKGSELQVSVTTDKSEMNGLADGFDAEAALYNIAIVKDGVPAEPAGEMCVYLTLADEINGVYASCYTVGEDGTLTSFKPYFEESSSLQKRVYKTTKLQSILTVTGHVNGKASDDFDIEDTILKKYLCADAVVTVPDGIKTIARGAFYYQYCDYSLRDLRNVKHVVLPEGLTEIEAEAFARYSLESIVIPGSIEVIHDDAFAYPPTPPIEPPPVQIGMWPITIYGKTLTVAENYATENKDRFIPTNTQLRGDVNGNGKFEAEDALGILRMVVDLDPKFGYSADADEDGNVTAADALHVLRIVVGLSSPMDKRTETVRAYLEFMDNHLIMQRDANGEIVREEDGTKYCRFEEKCEKEEAPCSFANMENAPVDVVINDVTVCDYDCDGEAEVFLFDTKKTNRIYICRKDRTQEGAYSWDEPLSPAVYYRNGIAFTNGTSIWRASYYWENPDDKIISTVSEEDDFLPGEVVIVMKREYSASNKRYSPEDFPGVDIKEIEYLTSLKENPDGSLIDIWDFRQILRLKLRDVSRQGVLDAIAVLNENQSVRSVSPNYPMEMCAD